MVRIREAGGGGKEKRIRCFNNGGLCFLFRRRQPYAGDTVIRELAFGRYPEGVFVPSVSLGARKQFPELFL